MQGLDRYAYVGNNPLRYVDPSGHSYCDSEFAFEEDCKDEPVGGGGGGGGGGSGDVELTEDGKKVLELFEWYRDTPGWWNDYGTKPFGIAEFLGLWLIFESGGNQEAAIALMTTIAQLMFVGSPTLDPVCQSRDSCDVNAILNFIGHNLDWEHSGLVKKEKAENKATQDPEDVTYGFMSFIGNQALFPGSVAIWDKNKGPTIWGNVVGYDELNNKLPKDQFENILYGLTDDTVFYSWDNFFIFTFDQYNYWALQVDLGLCDPPDVPC